MRRALFVGSRLFQERLKDIFAGSTLVPVGEASTLREAHHFLCTTQAEDQPADILMASGEASFDGDEREMLRSIRHNQSSMKIILLGEPMSLAMLRQAYPTSIDGFLLHTMPAATMMHAVDLIMSGQQILPPSSCATKSITCPLVEAPMDAKPTSGLSPREGQILQLLVVGSSNKAIARDLTISHETVKVHIKALLRKLKARNRTQAALWGLAHGIKQIGSVPEQSPNQPAAKPMSLPKRLAVRGISAISLFGLTALDGLMADGSIAAFL
jgi:two-component system, NarL family, nitrate/nitrite response regulator NarL